MTENAAETTPESVSDGLTELPEGQGTGKAPNASSAAGGSEAPTASEPKGNREARYRVERNDARAERDALAARLETLQTAELHRLAGEHLSTPEDISLSGKTLADFLTPEGWVDREAVAEAAAEVIASRPGLAKNIPAYDPTHGLGGGGKSSPRWEDLLKV